jgi:hypothetical protein
MSCSTTRTGDAALAEALRDPLYELTAFFDRDPGGRLVEQQQRDFDDGRSRELNKLPLGVRETRDQRVGIRRESELIDRALRDRAPLGIRRLRVGL